MQKRFHWVIFCGFLISAVVFLSSACTKEKPVAESEAAAPDKTAETQEQAGVEDVIEEPIFTRADHGPWNGKEESHLPEITYEKTDTGLEVTVTVKHEMNPETPHYIMWIKLEDGEGNQLGEKTFEATDEKAEAVFELTEIPQKLIAYEKCNLHGTWMEEKEVDLK
jgi:desulfoferrodoxin-like iron-binding protein